MKNIAFDIEKRPALRDQVYQELRRAILHGPIAPGTVLVQEELAEQLGISRTPVRDALDRLASEGLVTRSAGGRVQVATLSLEELGDKYAVRCVLEGLALRRAAQNMPADALAHLGQLVEEMRQAVADHDPQAVTAVGSAFHDTIIDACGNHYLRQLLINLNDSIRRYRHIAVDLPGRAAETLREHEEIYDALIRGDVETADRCMQAHIAHSQQQLEAAIRAHHTVSGSSGRDGERPGADGRR
jgi:DNA-binding GntR family transcriptional regulator